MHTILPVKVEITKSNKQYSEGSTGFICAAMPIPPYNVVKHKIVFNRFGRNGKDRLFSTDIYTPWLKVENFISQQDYEVYNRIKYTERFEQRQMHAIHSKNAVHDSRTPPLPDPYEIAFEPLNIPPYDLLQMSAWDFIAYITTLSLCIRIAEYSRFDYVVSVPQNRNIGPRANDLRNYLNEPAFGSTLGDHLLQEFYRAEKGRRDHDGVKFGDFVQLFSEISNRQSILNMLHIRMVSLQPSITSHMDLSLNRQFQFIQVIRDVISIYKAKPDLLDKATVGYDAPADAYPLPVRQDIVKIRPPRIFSRNDRMMTHSYSYRSQQNPARAASRATMMGIEEQVEVSPGDIQDSRPWTLVMGNNAEGYTQAGVDAEVLTTDSDTITDDDTAAQIDEPIVDESYPDREFHMTAERVDVGGEDGAVYDDPGYRRMDDNPIVERRERIFEGVLEDISPDIIRRWRR